MATATVPDLTNELLGSLGVSLGSEVDKAAESSGDVPPGKYHARQDSAKFNDGGGRSPRWEIWFVILAGIYRGRKVKYTLWTEAGTNDKDGAPKSPDKLAQDRARVKNEIDHAAGVLGWKVRLHGDAARRYVADQLKGRSGVTADQIARAADAAAADPKGLLVPVQGKFDFRDTQDAECVVKTKLRPSTQEGDDRKFAEVEPFGVLAFTDPKAKGVILATAGEKAAVANATHAAPPAEDMSDLVSKV